MTVRRLATRNCLVLLALAIAPAGAQEPAPAPPPVFGETVEVRVVNLEVSVTDRDGVPVGWVTLGPRAAFVKLERSLVGLVELVEELDDSRSQQGCPCSSARSAAVEFVQGLIGPICVTLVEA
jgi:hypothetical protein